MKTGFKAAFTRFAADYGILLALIVLCVYFSVATYTEQKPFGAAGGAQLAQELGRTAPAGASILIVARANREDAEFVDALRQGLDGFKILDTVRGQPRDARQALERIAATGERLDFIAANPATASWTVFENLGTKLPALSAAKLMVPRSYHGSNFLQPGNLLNVANQIAVIAIVAIGMTLVIITGGIDLSVGSLIALSAVVCTLLIRDVAGAEQAGVGGMLLGGAAGIAVCGLVGLLNGTAVALLRIPAFIVTLAMMLVASGLAFLFAKGQSVYQVPATFVWLGRGSDLGAPRAVWLMLALYVAAHFFMSRTRPGRYVYAVGSNEQAARLSGVPVAAVLLGVYTLSGVLAGLGGVVMASQLQSGGPTYGQMYELYVIAAVVVGGASLAGGEGKAFGTLIGAFIIAVIQNGMNLTAVPPYTQKVVLGLVILGAVMLDMIKRRGWRFRE
jgi:ribose transport system permease protein